MDKTDKPDEVILQHYAQEAQKHRDASVSTAADDVVRRKETTLIHNFFSLLDKKHATQPRDILEVGCGNAYTLSTLVPTRPKDQFWAIEFTPELLEIAKARKLDRCEIENGDARNLQYEDNSIDVAFTQRCLINILDWEEQKQAIQEINRVLKPGGYYLMLECFTDGFENLNKAREECGLDPLSIRHHNKYFNKESLFDFLNSEHLFNVVDPDELDPNNGRIVFQSNFLSSHYFIARVLHALVTKGPQTPNTEFVKFFSFLPPFGDYSQIQAFIFKKP